MLKKILRAALPAMFAMAFAGAAQATVVYTATQAFSGGPTQTDFTNNSIIINQFDSSLYDGATLNSVHVYLSVTATVSSVGTVLTCASASCIGSYSANMTGTLSLVAGNLAIAAPITAANYSHSFNLGFLGTSAAPVFTNTASTTTEFCVVSEPNCTSINPSLVTPFAGNGTVTLSFGGVGTNTVTTSGLAGFASGLPISASYEGYIQYDYIVQDTNVPEPMSLALLGSGLVGLGLIRRRKAA